MASSHWVLASTKVNLNVPLNSNRHDCDPGSSHNPLSSRGKLEPSGNQQPIADEHVNVSLGGLFDCGLSHSLTQHL